MTLKRPKIEKPFTEVELEIMNFVWLLGNCTVKEVQEALSKDRGLAYTSVATMMKILEQKGALQSEKKEKAHNYQPLISKIEYEKISLEHLKTNVFGGDPTSMVMRLLNDSDLSMEEIENIRSFVNEKLKG